MKNKAAGYPLICRLYIPLIEIHANKYKDFIDFDDWLLVPYFNWIWNATEKNAYGNLCQSRLTHCENQLEKIKNEMSDEEFEKMQEDLFNDSMHPAAYGVHCKILDFYAELKAMEHFINNGYSIKRIPKSKTKTPDFCAFNKIDSLEVEVKLIHSSNPIKDYINKYVVYLSALPTRLNIRDNLGMITGKSFSYTGKFEKFKQEDLNKIKKFIDYILHGAGNTEKLTLGEANSFEITYQKRNGFDSCLITIDDQVSFCIKELKCFLNDYISRRTGQAKSKFSGKNHNCFVYLLIQLDNEYNLPFEEFNAPKSKKIIDFLVKHAVNIDTGLILDFGNETYQLKNGQLLHCEFQLK